MFDVAEVVRDLYLIRKRHGLSFGESRLLETASELLIRELAVAKSESEDKIQGEIFNILENTANEQPN